MSFSLESESNNKMAFLYVEVSRKNGRFKTTVHRKSTPSSVSSHFDSFLPTAYKFCTMYILAYKCFNPLMSGVH